jgi:hypothetical protein
VQGFFMRHAENAMSNQKLDPDKRGTESVSSTGTIIKERRQQLAQQIGRLLARIWLRRHRENQINSTIAESMTETSSASR